MEVFVGIDPGKTGGIGVIDQAGRFVVCHRWNEKDPRRLYEVLLLLKGMVSKIYLELIQVFPQKEAGFIAQGQSTIANWGTWQGFLIAAGIPFDVISPLTWQAAHGLTSWAKRQEEGIPCHSPLTLARSMWPAAPLDCKVDDGKAVGLLLADLSRRDLAKGIDRGALRAQAQAKAKAAKSKKRAAKKAAGQNLDPWPNAPDIPF
jgi:hypothetical protein